MGQKFQIQELKESDWGIWDEWLLKLPYSSPFSTSWWLQAVCNIFGGTPHVFIVKNDKNEIIGGVGFREITFCSKRIITPSSLSLYMPIVVSKVLTSRELIDIEKELGSFLMNIYDVINITNTRELYDVRGFQWLSYNAEVRYTALLDLRSFDFNSIDRAERKQVKKAEREAMFTEPCDDIDLMYDLWVKTFERQNLDTPVSLTNIRYLYDAIRVHKAGQGFVTFSKDRNPASFRICIWNNLDLTYDWIAGSNPNYFKFGASASNLYSTLQYLKEKGFHEFDFCGANIESIADFKLSFGAKLVPYYCLHRAPLWFEVIYPLRNMLKKVLRRQYKSYGKN